MGTGAADVGDGSSRTYVPSAAESGVPEEERQVYADGVLDEMLPGAAIAGAFVFGLLALVEALFVAPPAVYLLVVLGAATSIALATLAWRAHNDQLPRHLLRPAVVVGLGLALLNAIGLSAVRPRPEATFAYGLVALAAGLLLLSRPWLGTILAVDTLAWLGLAILAPPAPGWTWWAPFVLAASLAVATLTAELRRRLHFALWDRDREIEALNAEIASTQEEVRRARRNRSRFLANVSHDVRAPASAIIGQAHDLRAGDVGKEQAQTLASIEESARHLIRVFDDITDIALADVGELSVEEEAVELESVLRQSLDMVASQARAKDLELALDVDPDVPAVVWTDPHRLKQVVGNLLSNAVKFTDEGKVEVRARLESSDPTVLRVEVEDTGIGIPEDRKAELFQPFGRIETSPEAEGTGLGLTICERIVELLGGEIGVTSTPGEGSIFAFTLPVSEADTQAVDAELSPQMAGRQAWVVGSSGFPVPLLERWGFEVETMGGTGFAEEAIESGRRPAVIILDLLTIEAPQTFLAERVHSWRQQGIPVLVSKPPDVELDELAEALEPESIFTPSIAERDLHARLTASLEPGAEEPAPPSSGHADLAQRHPLTILVVEASPANRQQLRSTLENMGYEPDDVPSGEEALARLEEERYDLVFLDLGLPGIDGLELVERIEASIEEPPRMVALTDSVEEDTMQEAEAVGISAYLHKPADVEDIVDEIDRTPSRSSQAPANGPEATEEA